MLLRASEGYSKVRDRWDFILVKKDQLGGVVRTHEREEGHAGGVSRIVVVLVETAVDFEVRLSLPL